MSCYGKELHLELFGSSHGPFVGMELDGVPAGEEIDTEALRLFLARRSPGRFEWTSARAESDEPEFLCGIVDGRSDGGRIRATIKNRDARSADYDDFSFVPRPGHADYPAAVKYGSAPVGGGQFSGRMTAPLCLAGGICMQILARRGVRIVARIASVGGISDEGELCELSAPGEFPTLSEESGIEMRRLIAAARAEGDSVGGVIECAVFGLPVGLGDALFDGMESRISSAVFAIGGVKGIEFGRGFASSRLRGSENNDPFVVRGGRVETDGNNCGGILGGITDGMPLVFRAAIKPTPTISKPQHSVDLRTLEPAKLESRGRHDPCIVPRAVPCVEAAAALALLDAVLSEEARLASSKPGLRSCIDRIDAEILRLYERRMELCGRIGEYKRANSSPLRDPIRESEKLEEAARRCACAPEGGARRLTELLMELGRERQEGGEE